MSFSILYGNVNVRIAASVYNVNDVNVSMSNNVNVIVSNVNVNVRHVRTFYTLILNLLIS